MVGFRKPWRILMQMAEPNPIATAAERSETRHVRVAGVLLVVASVLEVVAMSHHPSVGSHDVAGAVAEIGRISALSGIVHGALIALMLASLYCLTEFCVQRGLRRPLVRAGLVAYAAGVVSMFGAAMVSGFIITSMASQLRVATAVDQQISAQLLNLCALVNRTMANTGVIAMSAGIALWSIGLLHDSGLSRWIGALGCIVGLLPTAGLATGLLHLDVHGMGIVVLLQTCWSIGLGILLYRMAPDGLPSR